MQFTPEQEALLLDLAQATIRRQLGDASAKLPELGDAAFSQPAGAFVTLHTRQSHHLRGCMGRLEAQDPLAEVVAEMACAVLQDPRFTEDPVVLEELRGLELEITILSPLEPADHPLNFEPLQHGIYLRCSGVTGCFLPQVARETGWTRKQLLERLCTEKMGLHRDDWKLPSARLFRFTTRIIGPRPFTRV